MRQFGLSSNVQLEYLLPLVANNVKYQQEPIVKNRCWTDLEKIWFGILKKDYITKKYLQRDT